MTTAKCPSCGELRVDVKGRGNASCAACGAAFHPLALAFATLKRAGVDGPKLQHILATEGKKIAQCASCSEMFTTFPVLGETMHACVPCQSVWLAKGALDRFEMVASTATHTGPLSTTTMMMAVASVAAPAASSPDDAAPRRAHDADAIEASIDPPSGTFGIAQTLDPPAPKPEPPKPEPPKPEPPKVELKQVEPPKKAETSKPEPRVALDPPAPKPAAPGASAGMKPPPVSKPFNLTNGSPPSDKTGDKKRETTGEHKKRETTGEHKKRETTGEHKNPPKPAEKTGEKKKPAADLVLVQERSSPVARVAFVVVVLALGSFIAWRVAGGPNKHALGGGKGVAFGAAGVVVAPANVGERTVQRFTLPRPGGELAAWYVPSGGGHQGAGGEALLADLLGADLHLEVPRSFGELTVLNGELRQGERVGRFRAFFTTKDAWVLSASSKDAGFARTKEAEKFLTSFSDVD